MFLHELRNGELRLPVAVLLSADSSQDTWISLRLTYVGLEESGPTPEVGCTWDPNPGYKSDPVFWYREFRFLAGQADPADPSRFTIPFEADGKEGLISGYLAPDGQIHLKTVRGYDWAKGGGLMLTTDDPSGV